MSTHITEPVRPSIQPLYEHLSAAISLIGDYVVIQNPDHSIIWLNDVARASLGVPAGSSEGLMCYDLLEPMGMPCHNCPIERALATGKTVRERVVNNSTGEWEISCTPVRNPGGETTVVEVIQNRTDRHFESSPVACIALDKSHAIVASNDAWYSLMQTTPNETGPKRREPPRFCTLIAPSDIGMYEEIIESVQAGSEFPEDFRIRLVRSDGETFLARILTRNRRASDSPSNLHYFLVQDLSEEAELHDKFSSALARSRALLREVHHRVKNNIQIMLSMLNLQKESLTQDESKEVVRSFSRRIRSMVAVHEDLYISDRNSFLALDRYLDVLSREICTPESPSESPGYLMLHADAIECTAGTAITIGLLFNEIIDGIIVRSGKYRRDCVDGISVTLGDGSRYVTLSVEYEGDEIPADSLGNRLVEALGTQLEAGISRDIMGEKRIIRVQIPKRILFTDS